MTRRAKNESMDERIRQEARRVAARLHPDEFGQPVSIYYLLDKGIIQNLIPGYENETIRGKNLLKTKFYREYVKQAKILLAAWSKVISAGVERENPQDIRTLTQGIFDKSRSSGPTRGSPWLGPPRLPRGPSAGSPALEARPSTRQGRPPAQCLDP